MGVTVFPVQASNVSHKKNPRFEIERFKLPRRRPLLAARGKSSQAATYSPKHAPRNDQKNARNTSAHVALGGRIVGVDEIPQSFGQAGSLYESEIPEILTRGA